MGRNGKGKQRVGFPVCGKRMLQGEQGRRELRIRPVRISCGRKFGHDGNHEARIKTGTFTWWNEEANPQREMNDANTDRHEA
jgi:hypothetical protein